MNIKKKAEKYSYKKLITATKRIDNKLNQQLNKSLQRQRQKNFTNNNNNNQPIKSSFKNKSAQKILSIYQTHHQINSGKFKISNKNKIQTKPQDYHINLSQNRQQRIRTQTDEYQKTKTHKLNSFRKGNKEQLLTGSKQQNYSSIKPIYTNRLTTNNYHSTQNNHNINDLVHHRQNNSTLNRQHNGSNNQNNQKRLNLNSELFENIKNSKDSLQRYEIPQTSKNQKKNYSFRKGHDSYRSNKKTALEKFISESLQNLDYPLKKNKNNKISIKRNQQEKEKDRDRDREYVLMNTLSKSKQKDKSKEKDKEKQRISYNHQHQRHKTFFTNHDDHITTKQIIQDKPCKLPIRLKTEKDYKNQKDGKDEDIEKIEIKWEKKKKNPYDLSNDEIQVFGDRFPEGFEKIKLLGRGGFSLVWLGEHKKSKKKFAVKQIITESTHQTHQKQIKFCQNFFQFGGAIKKQFQDCLGIRNLVKLHYSFKNKKDTWLIYEKCGDSLGNCLYQLKGENYNGQKVYRIFYKDLYLMIRNDQTLLRKIILQIAKALELLAQCNIVHSDLKTQNILVKIKQNFDEDSKTVDAKISSARLKSQPSAKKIEMNNLSDLIEQVKLIDYGSSFKFGNLRQFSMATPEYMAPEILNFILYQNQLQYIPKLFEYVQNYNESWVVDIWSLGSVVLQIISGIPLWMSLKTIVKRKGKQLIRYGLFAVKGRTFDKIIRKQLQVVQNLDKYLAEENYSQMVIQEDIKYLLKRMLSLNPSKRISPTEIIEFLTENSQPNSQQSIDNLMMNHDNK